MAKLVLNESILTITPPSEVCYLIGVLSLKLFPLLRMSRKWNVALSQKKRKSFLRKRSNLWQIPTCKGLRMPKTTRVLYPI